MKLLWMIPLVASVALVAGCREEKQPAATFPQPVSYMVVGESGAGQTRRISGEVEAADRTDLAFQVSGRVETVEVSTGDSVREGQVLATLEKKDFDLAVRSAESRVASTNATLAEMSEMLRRQRNLFERGHVAQAAVDTAQSRFEAARSNHAVAEAERDLARLNRERTVLRAPFTGQIVERIAEPFMEISPRQTLFRIQQPSTLSVRVLVPETMIRQIAMGDPVEITFPSLRDAVVPGFISQVGALAQQGNAFSVKADLHDHHYDIRSGMTAQVMFHLQGDAKTQASYLIPLTALDLRKEAGNPEALARDADGARRAFVLVINPADMTLESREIRVRDIMNNQIKVVSGLAAGERVVIAGVAFLEPGEKVSLWRPIASSPTGATMP